jgi:hypothetical protein
MDTTGYTNCLLRAVVPPTPDPPRPSSNAGLIIGLSVGGFLLCLIFIVVIIAQVKKQRKAQADHSAGQVAGQAGTSAVDYTNYNDTSTIVHHYPPEGHPQRMFYQGNQPHQQENKVYYPGFN